MTEIRRETKETTIEAKIDIDGKGIYSIETGIGFFNHMLESFSKHSLIDMEIKCKGDLQVDFHHTVEDVGIVLGKALRDEIYPVRNIERFADSTIVMDETSIKCAIDLSNRPFLFFDIPIEGKVGEFDTELSEEFFRALTLNAGINAHIVKERGTNKHHLLEATFKAFAITLRRALRKNSRIKIPSTKGVI